VADAGEPIRAAVEREPRVQPARVARPQAADYLFEEEPAATEHDEREPLLARVSAGLCWAAAPTGTCSSASAVPVRC
jgi:hypothetical protein